MNNKGFAITTILLGTFVLFMMLLLAMLGILSNYKDKMDILIDSNNGARDIVDIYKKDALFMTINNRKYYKTNDGIAIIGYVYNGTYTGPVLVSTVEAAVSYYTDYDKTKKWNSSGSLVHNGTVYYYSSDQYWMECGTDKVTGNIKWHGISQSATVEEAALKLLEEKVKYFVDG